MSEELDPIQMAIRDASQALAVPEKSLSGLSTLAQALVRAQTDLESAEELLKAKKERVRQLQEGDIPKLMAELGMSDFTFKDGSKILVKHSVAVTVVDKQAAYQWMRDHGHDGIIKTEITMSYGRGEIEEAEKMVARIRKSTNHPVDLEETVHYSTLKAWSSSVYFDENLEDEDKLPCGPDDPFRAYEYDKAEVKLPKAKKSKE